MNDSNKLIHKIQIKYAVLLLVAPVIIISDQYTKSLVVNHFYLGQSISVISGFFNLTYVRNPGAAFGMMNTWDPSIRIPLMIGIPIIALAAIFYVFKKLRKEDNLIATALTLVIGGAIGNLIDRIRLNYVVDFLEFFYKNHYFPSFNIADSAISIGVTLLILDMLKREFKKEKTE